MTRELMTKIDNDAMEALLPVAQKYGLTVTTGGGTYDRTGIYKPKIVFKSADADQRTFERDAFLFDLKPEIFGKSFSSGGYTYKIVGLRPAAGKRPILCERSDGKMYTFPATSVKNLVGLTFKENF